MSGLFQRTAFGIFNGMAPVTIGPEGQQLPAPKCLPYRFDFSSVSEITDDLLTENISGELKFVQSVYINNRDNDVEFRIKFAVTNQEIVCPANCTGIFPVFAPDQTKFTGTMTAQANRIVEVLFLNIPMPLTQWGPTTVNIANVTATFTPTKGAFSDASNTTTPATSTILFASNANAIRRVVQNPSSNVESLWINFGGAAASSSDSIEITPGGKFDTDTGPIDTTEWTIIAVNAIPYVAKEMV